MRIAPRPQVGWAQRPEDAMNIMLWYLPFAMFTETCDLVIAECKASAEDKPNAVRTRRPALHPRRGSAEDRVVA
jgi:hypothetical protein